MPRREGNNQALDFTECHLAQLVREYPVMASQYEVGISSVGKGQHVLAGAAQQVVFAQLEEAISGYPVLSEVAGETLDLNDV